MERTPLRPLHGTAAAAAAVLALAGCGAPDGGDGGGPGAAGSPSADGGAGGSGGGAPAALDFSAPLVGGGEIDGADLQGEPVVLWFWAPWCTVCKGEAPSVAEAAERYDGEVEFIGVAGQGGVPEMEEFVESTGTDGMRHIVDEDGSIWSGFEVTIQPSFSFLRDSGTFLTYSGTMSEKDLDERISSEVLGE
ncbi:redoxin domain-containing protein [Nocardiopsis sp. RSe5-2]|uniref:Redoxin domain-containing protein n=1 Tax=Nocardiopsis endophytica TaxID=3018445 RepID=A0ABT4U8C6_9ACTN|nr:redoxin domain-containing protein [Nocardiopsis endophytica]MDA2813196.1 redoxin domain-containing protein [Nocardiopsis endophytica]